MVWMTSVCFFFSSRRRHTRCSRDWSSDVCSSDLNNLLDFSATGPHPRNSSAATNQCAGTIVPPELSRDLQSRWRDLFSFQRFSLYSSVRAVALTEETRSELFNLSTARAAHLQHRRHKALSVLRRRLGSDKRPIRSLSGHVFRCHTASLVHSLRGLDLGRVDGRHLRGIV